MNAVAPASPRTPLPAAPSAVPETSDDARFAEVFAAHAPPGERTVGRDQARPDHAPRSERATPNHPAGDTAAVPAGEPAGPGHATERADDGAVAADRGTPSTDAAIAALGVALQPVMPPAMPVAATTPAVLHACAAAGATTRPTTRPTAPLEPALPTPAGHQAASDVPAATVTVTAGVTVTVSPAPSDAVAAEPSAGPADEPIAIVPALAVPTESGDSPADPTNSVALHVGPAATTSPVAANAAPAEPDHPTAATDTNEPAPGDAEHGAAADPPSRVHAPDRHDGMPVDPARQATGIARTGRPEATAVPVPAASDTLADQSVDLLARAELNRLTGGSSRLDVEIATGALGRVRVEGVDHRGAVSIQIHTDRADARALLDGQLGGLHADLAGADVSARGDGEPGEPTSGRPARPSSRPVPAPASRAATPPDRSMSASRGVDLYA